MFPFVLEREIILTIIMLYNWTRICLLGLVSVAWAEQIPESTSVS